MSLEHIKSIYNFSDAVIRNTPILTGCNDELTDLADNDFDIELAKKIMAKDNYFIKKIEYHAIDYVFNQKFCFHSRFTDGSYPVWYGSLDQYTTFYETAFHWQQQIIQDMYYDQGIPITINRSLFLVTCNSMLVDLRQTTKKIPELTDKKLESYKVTQALSKEIHKQGFPGLYTYSARKDKGENIAIYNRQSLDEVKYLKDIYYIYDFKKSKIYIRDKLSKKTILEL